MIGKTYCGIKVLALSEIQDTGKADILITCKNVDEITKQLQEAGVENRCISVGNSEGAIMGYLCRFPIDQLVFHTNGVETAGPDKKIYFDFNNGLVLGEWKHGHSKWQTSCAGKDMTYHLSQITSLPLR